MVVKINTKRGLLRLWLAFSVLWVFWHGYHAWEAYQSEKTWDGITDSYFKMMRDTESASESAPVFHQGGLDKDYYMARSRFYTAEFEKAAIERESSTESLEESKQAMLLPLVLLASYPLGLWIYKGFAPK